MNWVVIIAEYEQRIKVREQVIEDINNNYMPLRDKCVDIIRKNGLNHGTLKERNMR